MRRKILSEKPTAPESFVIPSALAKLFGCEAGVLTHSPDHVRLVGKPCLSGKLGPVEIAHLHGFVQFGKELLRVANAVQVSLSLTPVRDLIRRAIWRLLRPELVSSALNTRRAIRSVSHFVDVVAPQP